MNKRCVDCFYVKFCLTDPDEICCSKFLDETHVFVAPAAIGDTVYYIGGIHNTCVKEAKVEGIIFEECSVKLALVTRNNIHFECYSREIFATPEDAQKHIKERDNGKS